LCDILQHRERVEGCHDAKLAHLYQPVAALDGCNNGSLHGARIALPGAAISDW
jgi:hypothetical protein